MFYAYVLENPKGNRYTGSTDNLVDDGGLTKLLNFVKQEDNQAKTQSQNDDLSRLAIEFGSLTDNRTTAYARFQGLVGIKE